LFKSIHKVGSLIYFVIQAIPYALLHLLLPLRHCFRSSLVSTSPSETRISRVNSLRQYPIFPISAIDGVPVCSTLASARIGSCPAPVYFRSHKKSTHTVLLWVMPFARNPYLLDIDS